MSAHSLHMRRALALAKLQRDRTTPNPSVGCVILDRDGHRLSEAATADGGRPHAEELALARLPVGAAVGGTAYVTLEPCRQRSSDQASCSQRLIEAGLTKVIIATLDPHPLGSGGLARLREAGLHVEIGTLRAEADEFYEEFFKAVKSADS
ncbi:MAG: bifunctional diaminohydroxyphosphoribosylaminopyrimidine deaminase/5-amino-6-(5-phosphoribosylamino)uracil reductase RibD [Pseudomonadota bacterium]